MSSDASMEAVVQKLAAANAHIDWLEQKLTEKRYFPGEPDYCADFLAVWNKSTDHFLGNEKFMQSYRLGMDSGHAIGRERGSSDDLHIEWRIHTCCWAAKHASMLEGDFVECGVNTGIMSLAICNYLDFNTLNKNFWLFDTFEGAPLEQMTPVEKEEGRAVENKHYFDCYDITRQNFAPWPRANLVKGAIPGTLGTVDIPRVSYLCIDMNFVEPERAALEFFWPRLVKGGLVVFDDYGWKQCRRQKDAHDEWARRTGVEIMLLPTGQGLLIKP
ncbi:TylF/MycF family methyltransferase [Aurantimonas sp. MSK8Z-1]|uniref:TylF/MycF/NovP-related O-methyltransferase n=1 Tax=Mangrovibrevibacter kandeliae TaxID=2968473 RepID=UPI0021173DFB|nr:TylF/MycF/NovP-related O-methyltransferase [Aurantimonas sp. MSK8Z-1]MCW4117001.1 TylF/MycF family methyltransferase [Aurantimonas sp. MSK8Z-1]